MIHLHYMDQAASLTWYMNTNKYIQPYVVILDYGT